MFKNEDEMNTFFENEKFRKYHYLTYAEFIELFGWTIDINYIPKINKKIIYCHFDYFNYCYDQTWQYKWYPIFTAFAFNLSTSPFIPFPIPFLTLLHCDYPSAIQINKYHWDISVSLHV